MNKEDIIRMAREAGFHPWYSDPAREYHYGVVRKFAALVAAAEREACAKVCDELVEFYEKRQEDGEAYGVFSAGQAIRERGK